MEREIVATRLCPIKKTAEEEMIGQRKEESQMFWTRSDEVGGCSGSSVKLKLFAGPRCEV